MLRQTNNIFVRQSGKTMHKIIMIFVALAIAVVCYSITVYAWYQDSISNDSNSITVGTFSADIQILDESDTVLWDSAADFPDGILGYEGNISLPVGTKPVSLKITNADADALSFQYYLLSRNNRKKSTGWKRLGKLYYNLSGFSVKLYRTISEFAHLI